MTTIAWDGRMLAADKRATSNGLSRTVTKIRQVGNELVGGSGDADLLVEMMDWYAAGADMAKRPSLQADKSDFINFMRVDENGHVQVMERALSWIEFEDPIFACGSGRDFALAAMHLGKAADEAVTVAAYFDCNTGSGVDCFVHPKFR